LHHYAQVSSPFGTFGIVWTETAEGPRVQRVFLPSLKGTGEVQMRATYPDVRPGAHPLIVDLGQRMRAFLEGEALSFDLEIAALERCTDFQQRVLLAEHAIPRGWVSTYGHIAVHLGVPGGARAVGMALAHNPFPILIPCHRAIRAGGEIGGYQGGSAMKRALLVMEGVKFSPTGHVAMDKVYFTDTDPVSGEQVESLHPLKIC